MITTLVLAAVVSLASVDARAARTATEPFDARLELDTSRAGAGADVIQRRVEERANVVLRHEAVLPGEADDPAIVIEVVETDGDEPGFEVRILLRAADGTTLGEDKQVGCALCTETELVALVEGEVAEAVGRLRHALESAEAPPVEAPPVPTETNADRPKATGLLAGGVGLLVVGGGSLGAGIGLAVREPTVDRDNPLDLVTTRPVGYALIGVGAGLAIAGGVMTAVAVKRRKSPPAVSFAPELAPDHVGVVVGGRF